MSSIVAKRVVVSAALALAATAAAAQPGPIKNYTSIDAVRGTPVRIGYYVSADRKNCKPVRPPTIRVVEPPKEGALTVKTGQITTSQIPGCPRMTLSGQAVLYTARNGEADIDRLAYEVTSATGEVVTYQVTVNISEKRQAPVSPSQSEQKI